MKNKINISIIGMGYVGLPLACKFGSHYPTIGFDINNIRINQLKKHEDKTKEVSNSEIKNSKKLSFTSDEYLLKDSNIYIITVPTPINSKKKPDFRPLKSASKIVAKNLKLNDIVIYESTVYPGATEEVCVPILEQYSGLVFNEDFFCGYSPERINPGDQGHRLENIVKIVSGSNLKSKKLISKLYSKIIKAGIHEAPNIKTAEASKVIENIQRDLNIALMNELSQIFKQLDIDTNEVLKGSSTKWNFNKYYPGLVGGHCIGVDPYYLTYKSKQVGVNPKIILAGRQLNDHMVKYVTSQIIKILKEKKIYKRKLKVLLLGLTFKENCPDIRNSKSIELAHTLIDNKFNVYLNDPYYSSLKHKKYNFQFDLKLNKKKFYDVVIISVPHRIYKKNGIRLINSLVKKEGIIIDLKSIYKKNESDFRL